LLLITVNEFIVHPVNALVELRLYAWALLWTKRGRSKISVACGTGELPSCQFCMAGIVTSFSFRFIFLDLNSL
jgi:hypothetical protein